MYKLLPILLFTYSLAVTSDKIYDNSYALIIGIDQYQNVQKLHYAVKDAESIRNLLLKYFEFPDGNISIIKNEYATKQNILEEFSKITRIAKQNDRVLIFFAGHGETMDLPGGGEMGYLLPVDGKKDNLFATSIPMDDIKRISLMSKSKHMLFLIDACYGGLIAVGSRGLDANVTKNYIEKITQNKSRQIITAGGRDEQVIEKAEWGHSAFTLNLKRGLKDGNADMNADGFITANELGMFLSEKVTIDSDNKQTPQYGRMTSEEGEFVFNTPISTLYKNELEVIDEDQLAESGLIQMLSEQLKQSSELNKILLQQFKELDNQEKMSGIEEIQIDELNTNNVEIEKNNLQSYKLKDNKSIKKAKVLGFIYPGLGYIYEGDYRKGSIWATFFTSSIIADFLLFKSYKNNTNIHAQNISSYKNAIEGFDVLRIQCNNSNKKLTQSNTLLITGCITSGIVWYLSISDHNKYHDKIDINISSSEIKILFNI